MKKLFKVIMLALIVSVLCLPIIGCGDNADNGNDNGGGSSAVDGNFMLRGNDFLNDDNRRPDRNKDADNAVYAPINGSVDGKVQLYPRNDSRNGKAGYDDGSNANGWMRDYGAGAEPTEYTMGEFSDGTPRVYPYHLWAKVGEEYGAVYRFKGIGDANIPANWHFTPLSPYAVKKENTYKITYTLENQGTENLTLKLYQINSGSSPFVGFSTDDFTLAVGELKTVELTFNGFDNSNLMTTVQVKNSIKSLQLGMYQYIAKQSS